MMTVVDVMIMDNVWSTSGCMIIIMRVAAGPGHWNAMGYVVMLL